MDEIPSKKTGLSRVVAALFYSLSGIRAAFSNEAAFRQEATLFLLFLPVLVLLPVAVSVKLLLLTANTLVLITELFNSAIEAVVDMVSTDFHPLAKRAKDIGSAAVFLSLILAAFLWVSVIILTLMS